MFVVGSAGSREKITRQSSGTIPDVSTKGPAQTSQLRVRESSMDASQDKWLVLVSYLQLQEGWSPCYDKT